MLDQLQLDHKLLTGAESSNLQVHFNKVQVECQTMPNKLQSVHLLLTPQNSKGFKNRCAPSTLDPRTRTHVHVCRRGLRCAPTNPTENS